MGGEVRSEKEEVTLDQIKAWLDALTVISGRLQTDVITMPTV